MEEAFRADYKKAIEGVSSPVEFEVYLYRRCFQAESTITHLEARIKELEGAFLQTIIETGSLLSEACKNIDFDNLLNKGE